MKPAEDKKDKAAFICAQNTLDGAYPSLVLGMSAPLLLMVGIILYQFQVSPKN